MLRIFISYRRNDSRWAATLLREKLAARFGPDSTFLDHRRIEPGADFQREIEAQLAACDVLVAIIGREWLNSRDAHGGRRLDDPDDLVVQETATALERGIAVVPLLVDGATMPRADELPPRIAALATRQALETNERRFDQDVERLVEMVGARAQKRLSGEAVRAHREAIVQRLEERRGTFARDLQRNVLDFHIPARGATSAPQKDAPPADPLGDLLMPSIRRRKPAIVLADFGMGKTWFLEHLQYELAREADGPVPLWVSLRGFRIAGGSAIAALMEKLGGGPTLVEQLRQSAWVDAFGERFTETHQAELVERFDNGGFVLFLDALDEMLLGTRKERDHVLTELANLSRRTRTSAIVLTCRRTFFTDAAQEKGLVDLGLDVFYLQPWARADIAAYLQKVHAAGILGIDPEAVLRKIERTYDLEDLASRAMLAAMLADQWETLADPGHIDLPSLYERHVEKAVLGWQARRNWLLEEHQVQQCMEEIAFLMFKLDSLAVAPRELDEYFSRQLGALKIERFSAIAESFIRDIRTNSLLQREGNSYSFCHASIWEFLVARRLKRALEEKDKEAFRVTSRATHYDSIARNFLIPMLRANNQLALIGALYPGR